ncbi:MAG: hypothetical protein VB860_03055 [Dehalococcoidia bacterium]
MKEALQKEPAACVRCGRELNSTAYDLMLNATRAPHCLRCAVQFRPMLKRSLVVGLIVGTLQTAINQGNFIFVGELPAPLAWKIPLTFAVPFIVATLGGLLNVRATVADRADRTG